MNRRISIVVGAAVVLAACGGTDDESIGGPEGSSDIDQTEQVAESEQGEEAAVDGLEVPTGLGGYNRVCSTEVGFAGAAAYDADAPGPHQIATFRRSDVDDSFVIDIRTLPAGWAVDPSGSDVAAVELVSCLDVVERTSTGIICDLEADDGTTSSLELVDVTYSIDIRAAVTGESIGETTIEVVDETCPTFTFVSEGQTQYINRLTEDQFTNAVKPFVAPEGTSGDPTELPQFDADFSRICDTQVGFGGATPLSDGTGPRPVILFQETDTGIFVESSPELPAGWRIDADLDFEDNTELEPLELVACSSVSARTPNGVVCELEDDDGSITSLNVVDVSYELTLYEATTGIVVGTTTIEAASERCPTFVFVDAGQTDYLNTPTTDQYIVALEPFVTPG